MIKGINQMKSTEEYEQEEITPKPEVKSETKVSDRNDKIRFEDGDIGLEAMADEVHQVWCMWMEYLFKQGWTLTDKGFKIDSESVKRWKRQMITPYAQLSEIEKRSERAIASRYLNIAWLPDKTDGRVGLFLIEDEENND